MAKDNKSALKDWVIGLIRFSVICNVLAILTVIIIELSTSFFGIQYWTDYVFFSLVLQWGVAALFFMYPPLGGMGASDDRADRITDSMVDRSVADEVDGVRLSDNSIFCLKMIIAGLPALVVCGVASLIT